MCVFVCVCICMYVCVTVYVCICVYMCMCVFVHMCAYVCVCVYMCAYVCMCICARMFVCICMCACLCVATYVCMYVYVCVYVCVQYVSVYSKSQRKKRNVITLQKDYRKLATVRTTHVLHKTTNRTTPNYRLYYTKLHYTDNAMDKLSAHATDTNLVSCTQI